MTERHAREVLRFHWLIGAAAASLASLHMVAVMATSHGIKPYSTLGWLPEMLVLGIAVLLPGLAVLISSRALARCSILAPLMASACLGIISCAEFLRYFAPMPAAFALLAIVDCALVSQHCHPRGLANALTALFMLALTAIASFFVVSYTSAGL
jgi:hypothetical protein